MITRLWKLRYLRLAAMALAGVAVAGATVIVTASAAGVSFGSRPSAASSNTSSLDAKTASTACADFMKHFAVDIGKSQAEINAAFQKAIAETLADEVKAGQITQAQADAITKKLTSQTPCNLPSSGARKPGGDKAGIGLYMQQYLAAAAAALGLSQTQLTADLKAGQSLSQVAAAQHVSEADFRTKVIANLKPTLDKAVADKKLTADQEQKIITGLQTGPLPLWNLPAARPKPPAASATPTPKTV